MEDKKILESIERLNSKMGVLIALQLNQDGNLKLKDKIFLLEDLGLNNSEIASILGISKVHVAKEKSVRKKKNG